MSIASQIASRVHVSASNRALLREVRNAFRLEVRSDPALRDARKEVYRDALKAHAAHKSLCIEFRL